jgi:hypothetical protein
LLKFISAVREFKGFPLSESVAVLAILLDVEKDVQSFVGTWEEGRGKREEGRGKREEGRGKREGRGIVGERGEQGGGGRMGAFGEGRPGANFFTLIFFSNFSSELPQISFRVFRDPGT